MERPGGRVVLPSASCTELAGESPVRVSAGAPGSRLPSSAFERTPTKRSVKSPRRRGATKRVATVREAYSLVRVSAERRTVGPSRSCHGEGNRHQAENSGAADGPTRGRGRDTIRELGAEQERPSSAAPRRGRDPAYKAKPKGLRSREGVRGARSTDEGGAKKPLEGRGPALVMRELEVSARAWL